jgi:hypothetical protein
MSYPHHLLPPPQNKGRPTTPHIPSCQRLFSLCFSESCTLFLLLMRQAFDAFNIRCAELITPHRPFLSAYSTRLLNWQISLYAVLLNIIILIPLSLCLVSTTSSNSCESHIYICLLQDHTNLANFCVHSSQLSPRTRHPGPALRIFPLIILRPAAGWYCLFWNE